MGLHGVARSSSAPSLVVHERSQLQASATLPSVLETCGPTVVRSLTIPLGVRREAGFLLDNAGLSAVFPTTRNPKEIAP